MHYSMCHWIIINNASLFEQLVKERLLLTTYSSCVLHCNAFYCIKLFLYVKYELYMKLTGIAVK